MSIQTPSLQVRHKQYSLNELLLEFTRSVTTDSRELQIVSLSNRFLKVAHKKDEFNTCVIVMIEEFRLFHQTIVVEYPSQYNDFFVEGT